jgi:DNA-binding response OmpR family regulator
MRDILVIDDDPIYGQLVLQRLELTCFSSSLHLGPFGTMSAIRQLQPQLVILDVTMPGLDGTRISEMIRKTRSLSDIRVMFHSSLSQRELDPLVLAHGADAGLHKSATRGEFTALVHELMRTAKRRTQP